MDTISFHKLRQAVQENAHPADDHHAQLLQDTLENALVASRLFSEVEIGRTDDPDQMVIGVGRCAERILPWEAGIGVERLWAKAAVDARWEAHTVACTESLMEFEGALTFDDSGHYVTVHLVAEPAVMPEPVAADADAEAQEMSEAVAGTTEAEPAQL